MAVVDTTPEEIRGAAILVTNAADVFGVIKFLSDRA